MIGPIKVRSILVDSLEKVDHGMDRSSSIDVDVDS